MCAVTSVTRIGLIGAPTSAGAFAPGQEKAPAALRAAGLIGRLEAAGVEVVDRGDVPAYRWRPDRARPDAMNLAAVRATALAVADRVEQALRDGLLPLVVGGDCTVELGTVLGWRRAHGAATLLYVDPHPDMNTPESVRVGALDWMGVGHMLGVPGAERTLVALGGDGPLLAPRDILLFGYSEHRATPSERRLVAELGIAAIAQADVAAAPAAAGARAVGLTAGRGPVLVHFDTDSVDFADLPLAEDTERNAGLSFDAVASALERILAGAEVAAITVTEINPQHGEPGGATLERFLDRLVPVLARAA